MKAADLINQIKVINKCFTLLGKEADKLIKHKKVRKITPNNILKEWERDWILKDGGHANTLNKAVKNFLKTIEKARANDKMEEDLSDTKVKEPITNPTKNNMCRLIGHNPLWKHCLNNPNSKKYNESHYSKVQEQTQTSTPSKNEDRSTKSGDK